MVLGRFASFWLVLSGFGWFRVLATTTNNFDKFYDRAGWPGWDGEIMVSLNEIENLSLYEY